MLTALVLLLYAVAIAIAGDRRRQTLRAVGISFIFVGVVVLFARGAAGNLVVGSLSEVASSDAAVSSVYHIGSSLILETGQSIVLYGIVIVAAAWLAGPTRWATSIRRWLTPYLRQPAYAYGGLAALLLLVFWWDPVIATHRIVPSLLLIAFAALGTEMLRRQVIREASEPRVATAGAPSVAAGGDPRVGEIERLAGLRDSGALTEDEFAAEKARVLGPAGTSQ